MLTSLFEKATSHKPDTIPEDAALYAVLDLFQAAGHLEPAGA